MGKVVKKIGKAVGAVAGIASNIPGLEAAAPWLKVAGIAGNLIGGSGGGGGGTAQGNTANGAYFDYFASSRPQYGSRLNTLMGYGGTPGTAEVTTKNKPLSYSAWRALPENTPTAGISGIRNNRAAYNDYVKNIGSTTTAGTPGISGYQAAIDEVMNSPGYMGGMREGQRTLAAGLARTGQVGSGAEQIAYGNLGQDYFRKSYQDLFNQYASLSGATQQPLTMSSANQLGASQQRLQDQAWAQGIGAIGDIFQSTSTNPSINSNPAGYSSGYVAGSTPNYSPTNYSPTDTNMGMGGYTGPANMGGGLVGPSWA
jgi:hypothetical protein